MPTYRQAAGKVANEINLGGERGGGERGPKSTWEGLRGGGNQPGRGFGGFRPQVDLGQHPWDPDPLQTRLNKALRSLDGLSVGDAFGERFFGNPVEVLLRIRDRILPPGPWHFTDDTVMALSIVDVLATHGLVETAQLARLFAKRYQMDPGRGYGGIAHEILGKIAAGAPWELEAARPFDGQGSMGNGGAMRAAPIGAYFAGDLAAVREAAADSARITHAHPEGQAGAIAVAIASAWMADGGTDAADLFATVLRHTPPGDTRSGIEQASRLDARTPSREAASSLGNGSRVIASDTVPFCIWSVAVNLGRYEEAMWSTVAGLGDRDTTCAIVGGILAAHPAVTVPPAWLSARESFAFFEPAWQAPTGGVPSADATKTAPERK